MRAAPTNGVLATLLLLTLAGAGCSSQVAGNLDEVSANRLVLALDWGGIAASKGPDAHNPGRTIVTVPSAEETRALALLAEHELPLDEPSSRLDALGKDTLVLSRSAEQAKLRSVLAAELERSLIAIEGVLRARVHLSVDPRSESLDAPPAPVPLGASVLFRYQGEVPPISASDVQRLISGAVPGVPTDRVEIVMLRAKAFEATEARLARIGPFVIASGSIAPFKLFVATLGCLNLLLIGVVAGLWLKLRRQRSEPSSGPSQAAFDDAREAR